jgi:Trk K+ transport system NAD-binding subunit
VVCGYGRFGRELIEDVQAEGLDVTVVDPLADTADGTAEDPAVVCGHGFETAVPEQAGVAEAVGYVAGTDSDTSNLSLIASARRSTPRSSWRPGRTGCERAPRPD